MRSKKWRSALAGTLAGIVNGLFGAGGGMLLVPLLRSSGVFGEDEVFRASVIIMLPMCILSLALGTKGSLPWSEALPYLLGAIPGGLAAIVIGKRIRTLWLHRILGVLILYGGVRYLC